MVSRSGFPYKLIALIAVVMFCMTIFVVSCGNDKGDAGMDTSPGDEYARSQLIVKFKGDVKSEDAARLVSENGGSAIIETIGPEEDNVYLISLEPGVQVMEAVDSFGSLEEVEYAEPNYIRSIQE